MIDIHEIVDRFSDKDIRIIEQDGDFWIPVVDMARAMNYDIDKLRKIISRNIAVFSQGMLGEVTVSTPGGKQVAKAVNEVGFYSLISKISINSIEDDNIKEGIIKFQVWVANLIKQIRKDRSVKLVPMRTPGEVLKDEMSIAVMIQEYLGLDKTLMMVTAISRTEKQTGTELTEYKNLLPPVVGPVAILTATEIGKQTGIPAAKVNIKLAELGFHEKKGGVWTLTESGKEYGAPFYENVNHGSGSTWQGVINKWSPKIIEMIRDMP